MSAAASAASHSWTTATFTGDWNNVGANGGHYGTLVSSASFDDMARELHNPNQTTVQWEQDVFHRMLQQLALFRTHRAQHYWRNYPLSEQVPDLANATFRITYLGHPPGDNTNPIFAVDILDEHYTPNGPDTEEHQKTGEWRLYTSLTGEEINWQSIFQYNSPHPYFEGTSGVMAHIANTTSHFHYTSTNGYYAVDGQGDVTLFDLNKDSASTQGWHANVWKQLDEHLANGGR